MIRQFQPLRTIVASGVLRTQRFFLERGDNTAQRYDDSSVPVVLSALRLIQVKNYEVSFLFGNH